MPSLVVEIRTELAKSQFIEGFHLTEVIGAFITSFYGVGMRSFTYLPVNAL